jgi:hypothetical protein
LNRLGATQLFIPETGASGAPMGMLEAALPLGLAEPPALPPAVLPQFFRVAAFPGRRTRASLWRARGLPQACA